MTIWYQFTIPRIEKPHYIILKREFLLRMYGRHTIVLSENGMTTCYKIVYKEPVTMDIRTAMNVISRYMCIPYIHHYTKVCRLEVIKCQA